MSTRKIPFCINETYHVYNRGVDKRIIFESNDDYTRMLLTMLLCNSREPIRIGTLLREKNVQGRTLDTLDTMLMLFKDAPKDTERIVDVLAYCLMPNHFHIILYERIEGGITQYLRKVMTSYTMYFNKKYDRNGVLFQGITKSQHIDNEGQYLAIFQYVHQNPISLKQKNWKDEGIKNKKEILKYLENYRYSSYRDYISKYSVFRPILSEEDSLPDKNEIILTL